jgi:uncharacterized protein (DUF1697 family)
MRAIGEAPLLSTEAIKQPLAYEHEVDAAIFLGTMRREPTDTEQLATAYYLQERTLQITGNIAFTGTQVAEKVEEMIEDVQSEGFLRSVVHDYRTATQPQNTLAEMWEFYKPDMSRQPKIKQILKRAAIFSPLAFLIDYEAVGTLLSQSPSMRIISAIGGSLVAGYTTSLRQTRYEDHIRQNTSGITADQVEPIAA